MAYKNYYQCLRVKSVQTFDDMYYEKGNHDRSHKRNWKRMGCFIFGISYDTYLSYLKRDTSDIPEIPSEAVEAMRKLTEELLLRENHPVRLKRVEKRPAVADGSAKSGKKPARRR